MANSTQPRQIVCGCRRACMAGAMGAALLSLPLLAAAASADSAAAAGGTQSDELVEIIVTASRHAENEQKESRPISVLSGEQLDQQGVTSAQSLNTLVPGLQTANSGDQLQIYIRGVGDRTVTAQTDPAVAFNYDGVYLPRAWEDVATFFDVNRLEVLKGPQGTLYGRNASAGALNVLPNLPGTDDIGGYIEAEGGNYSQRMFTGALNAPLSSDLAMRLSFQTNDHAGYLSDGNNDADTQAARLQFLFKPTDDLSVRLDAFYSHNGGHGQEPIIRPLIDPSNPWLAASNPVLNGAITGPPFFLYPVQSNSAQDVDTSITLVDFEWSLPGMTLTVLPAYVDGRESNYSYAGLIVTDESTTSKQSSIEIRLASADQSTTGSPGLQWTVGLYASHEQLSEVTAAQEGLVLGNLTTDFPKLNDTTYAAFGEAKYSILPALRIIGGVRYTWEQKVAQGSTTPGPAGDFTYPTAATTNFAGSIDFSNVSWRTGLEFDVAPQSMAYFTVSTGFKAGGFFAAPPPNTYLPEKLTAFELGIKNRFFDNRLEANLELFDWNYKNLQEQYISVLSSGGVGLVTQNAAQSTLRGADLSVAVLITQNDRFSTEAEYNHAYYGSFQYNTLFLGPPSTGCIATTMPVDHLNCSGLQLDKAPLWSGSVDYQHTFPLPNGSSLVFDAQEHFSSSYWLATDFTLPERAPSYALTNLILTDNVSRHFNVSAYVNNLTDRAVYNYAVQSPAAPTLGVVDISPPRTYGLRARYNF